MKLRIAAVAAPVLLAGAAVSAVVWASRSLEGLLADLGTFDEDALDAFDA